MKRIYIIGGGASGLMAALHAKNKNTNVTILERNEDIGKKILVTGNGKCNYFNEDQKVEYYHTSSTKDLNRILNKKTFKYVKDYFKELGIIPKIKNGYYYPNSNQAKSIVQAFNYELNNKGISLYTNEIVRTIEKSEEGFIIKTNNDTYYADAVILTTGSKAYYKFDNNGYDIACFLGHDLIPLLPSLVQLKAKDNLTYAKGIRADVELNLYESDELIQTSTGELQITDYGISGICAMQLSGNISRGLNENKKEKVVINFLPEIAKTKEEFYDYLMERKGKYNNKNLKELFNGLLNDKLFETLIYPLKLNGYEYLNELTKECIEKICHNIIEYPLDITGTNGFESAQVCSGGISLKEINIDTLESRLVDNLYFAGELLDVDGLCGGYNLTFAWISGYIAGTNAGNKND